MVLSVLMTCFGAAPVQETSGFFKLTPKDSLRAINDRSLSSIELECSNWQLLKMAIQCNPMGQAPASKFFLPLTGL